MKKYKNRLQFINNYIKKCLVILENHQTNNSIYRTVI
jgi:hypothetical protein